MLRGGRAFCGLLDISPYREYDKNGRLSIAAAGRMWKGCQSCRDWEGSRLDVSQSKGGGEESMGRNGKGYRAGMLLLSLFLSGCGVDAAGSPGTSAARVEEEKVTAATYGSQAPANPYKAPEYMGSAFHAEHAQGEGDVLLDLEHVGQGYVGISVVSDAKIKLLVLVGEDQSEQYTVPQDGTPVIFPLQMGDGTYTFKVMKHVKDKTYARIYAVDMNVKLEDEFQPFLRPNAYADYNEDSECVLLAAKLAATAEDELGVVGAVYDYICDNIVYDREKAEAVQTSTGYMPVLDETLETGEGICFDYASLAAGMLRSQGIPTKVVFGNVSPNDVYHAWNMFYTEETGWVTVEYEVKDDGWNRLDLTFSANGADSDFIGDGTNYLDVHYY